MSVTCVRFHWGLNRACRRRCSCEFESLSEHECCVAMPWSPRTRKRTCMLIAACPDCGLEGSGFHSWEGQAFVQNAQTGSEAHPTSCSYPGVNRPRCKVDNSPSSSAEGKNKWSYALFPLYAFVAWTWTDTLHHSSIHKWREKYMQSFSGKTRRAEKWDLNGKCVDVMR